MILKQKHWHALFEASVLIKAINGVWETISGLGLLLVSKVEIAHAVYGLTRRQMSAGAQDMAALYILAHGLVNLFLSYCLYKDKLWAFWVSIGFFSGSILFLSYRAAHSHSLILYGLIAFDIIFIYLTFHEYQYRKDLVGGEIVVQPQ